MTIEQATNAMNQHLKVEAGEGEDHDVGWIISVKPEEGLAVVSWQTGVRTPCPIEDLEVINYLNG